MKEVDFSYSYAEASRFGSINNEKALLLSHCSENDIEHKVACFFYGRFVDAYLASQCMATLAKTVRSHFAIAQGANIRLRDPIISVGNNQLRLEAFSSCNGVYARIDMAKEALDGDFLHEGCTNIDFNNATVRAFNEVGRKEKMIFGIGEKETHFITEKAHVIEKKVSLPNRWIKGLGNVQSYLADMEYAFTLTKVASILFFRTIPKSPVKNDYFVVKEVGSCYLSATKKSNSYCIAGVHRLALLDGLLSLVDSVSFYANEGNKSMAIHMHFKNMSMLFVFSPGVYRGFSGEGKTLENQSVLLPDNYITGINALSKTNQHFNPTLLAIESNINFKTIDSVMANLASIGLLGYDIQEQQHFYRRLPFKLNRLKSLNPRFANAQKLLVNKEIKIISKNTKMVVAEVKGTAGITHKVVLGINENRCTCNWYTKHQENRGLCKHILGVKMVLES